MKIAILKRYDINGSFTGDLDYKLVPFKELGEDSMWRLDKVIDFQELYFAADSIANAIEKNYNYLWTPNLEETLECIIVNPAGFLGDAEDEDSWQEHKGISDQIDKLHHSLNQHYERPKK
jgi:hypothetical protein